jgi:hypothetical protein
VDTGRDPCAGGVADPFEAGGIAGWWDSPDILIDAPPYRVTSMADMDFVAGNETGPEFRYEGLGQVERAAEYHTKAFELREHSLEREKLDISGNHCGWRSKLESGCIQIVMQPSPISNHIAMAARYTATRSSGSFAQDMDL